MAFLIPMAGSALASYAMGKGVNALGDAIGLAEGGRVQKEGLYHLHKGEVVVPANIVNKKAPATKHPAKKPKAGHKGAKSKTMAGRKDYTTKKTSKDFDRGGHRSKHAQGSKAKRKPFSKKPKGKGKKDKK